jgi:hypothetical protein
VVAVGSEDKDCVFLIVAGCFSDLVGERDCSTGDRFADFGDGVLSVVDSSVESVPKVTVISTPMVGSVKVKVAEEFRRSDVELERPKETDNTSSGVLITLQEGSVTATSVRTSCTIMLRFEAFRFQVYFSEPNDFKTINGSVSRSLVSAEFPGGSGLLMSDTGVVPSDFRIISASAVTLNSTVVRLVADSQLHCIANLHGFPALPI